MPPTSLRFLLAAVIACGVFVPAAGAQGAEALAPRLLVNGSRRLDPNAAILQSVRAMPRGGSYSVARGAFDSLVRAVGLGPAGLRLQPGTARPSFCSSATYLVFLGAMERLAQQGSVRWDAGTLATLPVREGQRDGEGVWGRWNANGPGTARLFTELRLGRNFTDYAEARPGDFMKIFWTAEIGQRERGHSVVYLGSHAIGGQPFDCYWSSNKASAPGDLSGYGEKLVSRAKIARVIFSRLENPQNITRARDLATTDTFLASLLSRRVTMEEVQRMCGL